MGKNNDDSLYEEVYIPRISHRESSITRDEANHIRNSNKKLYISCKSKGLFLHDIFLWS